MSRFFFHRAIFTLAMVALTAAAPAASACSVCFGDPASPLSEGLKWGVLLLLSIVTGVLAFVAAFFVYLARRSAAVAASGPSASAELSPSTSKI